MLASNFRPCLLPETMHSYVQDGTMTIITTLLGAVMSMFIDNWVSFRNYINRINKSI